MDCIIHSVTRTFYYVCHYVYFFIFISILSVSHKVAYLFREICRMICFNLLNIQFLVDKIIISFYYPFFILHFIGFKPFNKKQPFLEKRLFLSIYFMNLLISSANVVVFGVCILLLERQTSITR